MRHIKTNKTPKNFTRIDHFIYIDDGRKKSAKAAEIASYQLWELHTKTRTQKRHKHSIHSDTHDSQFLLISG